MRNRNNWNHEIDPDEIFLDSRNSPDFDTQQFEGRLERPISYSALVLLAAAFVLVFLLFSSRIFQLQVARGEYYQGKSAENRLEEQPIFGDRGVIYDRNKLELAWNETAEGKDFYMRAYRDTDGISELLGYVAHPKKDSSGLYWQTEVFGREGIEREYDTLLKGTTGKKLVETDAHGEIVSEGLVELPHNGDNITLSVDARVQEELYKRMRALAAQVGFTSGAGIIMDVETGELLAMASYPEYSSTLLSSGGNSAAIEALLRDPRKPFLNRAVSGLYTPGSIVKPYVALGALQEGIISPDKQILSTGSISIPNPYYPDQKSTFKDWKAHGLVDMRRAIAVSSDVYFYTVGGGFGDQEGLGIEKIDEYARRFGLAEPTGIDLPGEAEGAIPTPSWKAENFKGERWFIGDTYHTAIGQYGFQVTPLQMARAVAAIANEGTLVTPHLLMGRSGWERRDTGVSKKNFKIVKEG
ncbi:hypothetical protein KW797_02715, partial [Candidatus Parcubacteria bacterium]|nr:hypothetical protein [Candidatus Parcubacteria bacterium]